LAVLFLKQASWHEKKGVLMRVDRAYLSPDLFGVHRGERAGAGRAHGYMFSIHISLTCPPLEQIKYVARHVTAKQLGSRAAG
jgi:hypothetical protein